MLPKLFCNTSVILTNNSGALYPGVETRNVLYRRMIRLRLISQEHSLVGILNLVIVAHLTQTSYKLGLQLQKDVCLYQIINLFFL